MNQEQNNSAVKSVVRYSAPGKFDQAPYGSLCDVINGFGQKIDSYMQCSKDEEHPRWERIDA